MPSKRSRVLAVMEVLLVFLITAGIFHAIRRVEPLAAWQNAVFGGKQFAGYAVVLLLIVSGLALLPGGLARSAVILRPARYHLEFFTAAFLPIFILSASLAWIPWRTWYGAAIVSVLAVGLLWLTGWMLRRKPELSLPASISLLLLFPLLALRLSALYGAITSLGYFYLLVGPVEEIFFRGYALSRLDRAFGRPYCTWGIRWGAGLIISALLFGLWHVSANPLDLSLYPQALWTFFAGLIFGAVREKSGSIAAPALLHGVLNYGPQALLFDLIS
jgi:membrane protease YdiL (CAAX protease family)